MSWRPIDEARRWRGKHAGAQVQPTAGYEEGVRSRDYIGLKAERALLREEQLRLRRLAAAENVQSRDHVEKNERAPLSKDESEERRRSVSERGTGQGGGSRRSRPCHGRGNGAAQRATIGRRIAGATPGIFGPREESVRRNREVGGLGATTTTGNV